MPAQAAFRNDEIENLVRKCIVFPADGSETCLVHMIARTVTQEDITELQMHSRCVDMTSTFGDESRKTRVMQHLCIQDGAKRVTYLFFYNLSPKLPINLNIAHLIGVTPPHLKKRLFWRGDVVAMKVESESERIDFIVKSMDADLLELGSLEEDLRERYQVGFFEHMLHNDGDSCEQDPGRIVSHVNNAFREVPSFTPVAQFVQVQQ